MTNRRRRVRPIMIAAPLILTSLIAVLLATAADATSPGDNGRVAFRRYLTARNGCCDPRQVQGAIFTAPADGSGERQLTFPRKGFEDDEFPDWSPDGNRLAFERCTVKGCHIWTIASDGTRRCRVGPTKHLKPNDNEEDPAYSPNGKLIAFDHIAGPIRRGKLHGVQGIFTMRADGTRFRQVTQRGRATPPAEDRTPQWSPDGQSIVFARENISARPRGARAVFTIKADGTGLRRITPWSLNAGGVGAGPDWSPDGQRVLFTSNVANGRVQDLYTVRPDGSGLTQLTDFADRRQLTIPGSFSPDGRFILYAIGKGNDADVFVMNGDGSGARQLIHTPRWESAADWGSAP